MKLKTTSGYLHMHGKEITTLTLYCARQISRLRTQMLLDDSYQIQKLKDACFTVTIMLVKSIFFGSNTRIRDNRKTHL